MTRVSIWFQPLNPPPGNPELQRLLNAAAGLADGNVLGDCLSLRFAGDDKFFVGSDYPHAEGFVAPVRQTRECLASLPTESVDKILCVNARKFYRIA